MHKQYQGTLYIKVINSNGIPTKVNNQWVFSDPSLQTIFNSYGLTDFARGFPAIDQFPKHLKFGLDSVYLITCTGNETNLKTALQNSAVSYYNNIELVPENIPTATPNDYHLQDASQGIDWSLDLIQAKQAWDITTGSSAISIGIIETGIGGSSSGKLSCHKDPSENSAVGWDQLASSAGPPISISTMVLFN